MATLNPYKFNSNATSPIESIKGSIETHHSRILEKILAFFFQDLITFFKFPV